MLNLAISSGSNSAGFLPNIDKLALMIAGWYTGLGGTVVVSTHWIVSCLILLLGIEITGRVDIERIGLEDS